MALDVKSFSFTKSTGGAPVTQSITGIGFLPKALILWMTAQVSSGFATGYQASMGVSDGATDYAICNTFAP